MSSRIEVDYQFPAGTDAGRQACILAVGQTTGSWDIRYAHREAELHGHLGEVLRLEQRDDGSSLATVGYPLGNVDGRLGSLLTMILGKFSMAGPARVVELRLPEGYGQAAKFGLAGIRRHLDIRDRPLFMAIFKPALGLDAGDHARILAEVSQAGLDIIKDDEILPNLAAAPTLERWRACAPVLEERRCRSGRDMLYAVNLSGDARQVHSLARQLVLEGANALLLNVLAYGFPVLEALAADPEISVPIFAHPALAGALAGSRAHGFSYPVLLGTLMAHAGADAVLYPAHYGSLPITAGEENGVAAALRTRGVAPVPSAGVHPGILSAILKDYGEEVILNAGTGIMDHPDGAAAGVQAFHEAYACWQRGEVPEAGHLPDGPLRRAMEKWGGVQ